MGTVDLRAPDGSPLSGILVQPKRLAALARLAVLPAGTFLRRDVLLALLWPELDEPRARNALNKTVHHMRQVLGDGVLIGRGDEELGLADAKLRSDAAEFDACCARKDWDAALELYRGELLPGFHVADAPGFEEWLAGERERLRRQAANAAARAAERRTERGDIAGALAAAHRAVDLAPDDEPAVRRLMRLLDQQGDRAGALRAHDDFSSRLHREFGVVPGAETQELREVIVARGDATRPPPRATSRSASGPEQRVPEAVVPPVPRPRRRSGIVRALAVAVLAVTALGLLAQWKRRPDIAPPSPHTFAILPFTTTGSDTSLARLGQDLMVLISARVNGIADIRVIDPIAVLAQLDAAPAGSRDLRLSAALQALGATQMLEGSLIRVGDQVRIDGRLSTAGERQPMARIELTAPREDLVALADSVVLQLVGQLWPRGAQPSSGAPALATRSLPALRSFLDGERLLAEGRIDDATVSYRAAIAADSTFWPASWRYLYFQDDFGRSRYTALAERLRADRDRLPEPARTLVEARFTDSLAARDRLLAGATVRYPASWEAWYNYADNLFHWAPFQGGMIAETHRALERTVALNPGFANAWDHLFTVSLLEGDSVTARRALQALRRLQFDSSTVAGMGLDLLRIYRWFYQTQAAGGRPQPALSDSVALAVVDYHGPLSFSAFDVGPLRFGLAEAQIDIGERILRGSPSRGLADGQQRGIALAWAARGAWDSALATADRYAASTPLAEADLFRYRLAVIGAWLGDVPPIEAQRRRAAAAQTVADLPIDAAGELAWLDGVLAAARGDAKGIEAARARVRVLPPPMGGWLDRSLLGMAQALRGDRPASLATLATVEGERIDVHPYDQSNFRQPFLTAVNRMVLSRDLVASGDTVGALRQLRWAEAQLPVSALEQARAMIAGWVDLERARLEAATGQQELARRHYREFLRRYDRAVPAHQHLVEEARATLGQLEAIGCPDADSACPGSP